MYDRRCPQCQTVSLDCLERIEDNGKTCPQCGERMERAWLGKANGVIPDGIPGGMELKHGLCWPDGTPRKFYSKSEMAAEARRRGLVNHVTHVPPPDSDKSKHTSRWV